MKIYLIILLVGLTACSSLKSNKQTEIGNAKIAKYQPLEKFKGDTLQFVKRSILDRKEYYVGKELNILLKDLEIPVKKYSYTIIPTNRFLTDGLYIDIYSNFEQEKKIKEEIDPIRITVTWKEPIDKAISNKLIKNSQLNWTPEVAEYYGKQIIGDIGMVQYNFK